MGLERAQMYTADERFGIVAERRVWVHRADKCLGETCPIHRPSDHHMKDWTPVLRRDKGGLIERNCPHGVGHPDPDSMLYFRGLDPEWTQVMGVHGCDGCCHGG